MPLAVQRSWFAWFLTAYVLYALAFVYNSSVIVDGQRHFVLVDDAMISMTYARNLAHGHGAVWYPGAEPVQGYSNPLWMLFMALVHCFPLPPSMTSLPIQLTGVALIGGTLFFVKQIAERLVTESTLAAHAGQKRVPIASQSSAIAPFLAVLLTAFYLPLNNWTLRGMEVGAVALGITAAVWAAIRCADGKSYRWWLLPLLGLLTTVRMDAVVAGAVILLWLAWADPKRRRSTLVWGALALAFFMIGQMMVQKLYYGDWLPNTYYLKLLGIPLGRRIVWGAYVFFHFCVGLGLWLLMAAALYAVSERSKAVWLLVAVFAGQVAYSIYVGGDAWEWWGGANRYLCVAMPLLFILVAAALAKLRDLLAAPAARMSRQSTTAVVVGLGFLALIQANSYEFRVGNSLAQVLLVQKPPEWDGQRNMLETSFALRKVTTPQARVAVIWAGIVPYFSDRTPIDLLGKCDRRIAHGPDRPFEPPPLPFFASSPVPYWWPGHTKRDYRYSILEQQPDVLHVWYGMDEPQVRDFLRQNYVPMRAGPIQLTVNKNSKEIKFQELAPQ